MRSEILRTAVLVWFPGVALLAGAVIFSGLTGASMRTLLQDATTVLEAPFYVGALSLLGIILWTAGAAVCLFTASRLRATTSAAWRTFLLVSGIFTSLLLVDDAFLLHDEILPVHAGISGELYGLFYVAAMVAYLVTFRQAIALSNYVLLFVALVLFAISSATDLASSRLSEVIESRLVVLAEDGTKLLGIGTWLAYFVSVAGSALARPGAVHAAGLKRGP
jgi:hypothetical protein